jgi:hypothetical protein
LTAWSHSDLASVTPAIMKSFLKEQAGRGKTVAGSLVASFKFLETHLKLVFHTGDALVEPFSAKHLAHIAEQKPVFTFRMWNHLVQLAHSTSEVAIAARLVLRFTRSNLRFAHAKRAKLMQQMCTPRDLIYEISKGKDGQPFRCAVPVYFQAGWPMNAELQNTISKELGPEVASSVMLPLCILSDDGKSAVMHPIPCPYEKFTVLIRGLLQLPPLALSDEEAGAVTTYYARRLSPTVADALQLDPNDPNDCRAHW